MTEMGAHDILSAADWALYFIGGPAAAAYKIDLYFTISQYKIITASFLTGRVGIIG